MQFNKTDYGLDGVPGEPVIQIGSTLTCFELNHMKTHNKADKITQNN